MKAYFIGKHNKSAFGGRPEAGGQNSETSYSDYAEEGRWGGLVPLT